MTISGFSYVRNGIEYDYPFTEAIQSILPICDEFIMVVGDSTDGTRSAVEAIRSDKIRIIDTVWDMNLREGGRIFAQQANIGLDHATGDWAFHIQADEVMHEKDLPKITEALLRYKEDRRVDGLLLPFLHFWGSYNYIRTSRRPHKHEIRVVRNLPLIRSYRDSQGFRKYHSTAGYEAGEKGEKLTVVKVDAPVFHYSFVKKREVQSKKNHSFQTMYHADIPLQAEKVSGFDYQQVDRLEPFTDSHPAVMQPRIVAFDQPFTFDPQKAKWKTKDKLIQPLEDWLGIRVGEYKNYKLLK